MAASEQRPQFLERIVQLKRQELASCELRLPQRELEKKIKPRSARVFRRALLSPKSRGPRQGDASREGNPAQSESRGVSRAATVPGEKSPACAVIAEIKKASPSQGVLCERYDPAVIAKSYEQAGACALSVLTESEFFLGSLEHLRQVKAASLLPVLRKDFTLADYHLYEAAAAGADAVLLIVAILSPQELVRLLGLSRNLGLDAVVEVHQAEELHIALDAGSDIIGVNNRDLKTFEVSLTTSFRLISSIPDEVVAISESGLRTAVDLERLRAVGFDAFLIGERFMTQGDPGQALAHLLSQVDAREAVI